MGDAFEVSRTANRAALSNALVRNYDALANMSSDTFFRIMASTPRCKTLSLEEDDASFTRLDVEFECRDVLKRVACWESIWRNDWMRRNAFKVTMLSRYMRLQRLAH